MKRLLIVFALACLSLAVIGPRDASAVTFCTVKSVGAESKGHKTAAGAKARAWVNWQGKMRNLYGRKFSIARARPVSGYPKTSKQGRFNFSARVAAQGCYNGSQLCTTGVPNCLCMPYDQAKRNRCDFYAG